MTPEQIEELRGRLGGLSTDQKRQVMARVKREQEARRTLWQCRIPGCKGDPHYDAPSRHARADQRWPFKKGDGVWGALILAGRGWGKTRSAAEWVRWAVEHGYRRIGLVARTAGDVRDTVVDGESGVLAVWPSWQRPVYEPSKRRVTFHNGAIATTYTSEKPAGLRGPQHDFIVFDEYATFNKAEEVLSNALFGLRLGQEPRAIFCTTPKNTKAMRDLLKRPGLKVIRGRTADNLVNLAPTFRQNVMAQYEGTRTGRQELDGEMLTDVEGALLKWEDFDFDGFRPIEMPELSRVVVAADPAVTSSTKSDSTGISVIGEGAKDRRFYVLHTEALKGSPSVAMGRAVELYHAWGANVLVCEMNNGGDFVTEVVRNLDRTVAVKKVHASVGKKARAEPVAMLYEQHRVSHVGHPSLFVNIETLWTSWTPDEPDSPDELDANVWGLSWLAFKNRSGVEEQDDEAPAQRVRS